MKFNPQQRLGDILLTNHHLLPVLERLGIELGFGEKSVAEVCAAHRISQDFFLEVISTFHDRNYRPQSSIDRFPIPQTIGYLRKAHADYLENQVPRIAGQIGRLVSAGGDASNLEILRSFFQNYHVELHRHISREEERVFPYSLRINEAYFNRHCTAELMDEIDAYPINAYARDHDNVEEKLLDLKSILIKYIHVPGLHSQVQTILALLTDLEEDLNDHSRLEDLILVPVIVQMEQSLNLLAGRSVQVVDEQADAPLNRDSRFEAAASDTLLSERELEVLREVTRGLINKEIADKLFISPHTVITHRKNITRKLGIRTVAGLTVYAILNNIISLNELNPEDI